MSDLCAKRNFDRIGILIVLLVTLVTVPDELLAQSAQEIGEQFLRSMDDAYAARDIDAYADLLHDDLSYSANISQQGGPPQSISSTKRMLLQALPQNWSLVSDYTIERADIRVTTLENGDLLVENSLTESRNLRGARVTNESEQAITLDINGEQVRARGIAIITFSRIAPVNQQLNNLEDVSRESSGYEVPMNLDDGLSTGSIAEVSSNEQPIYKLLENLRNGEYGQIDSLLILKDGKLVVEEYYGRWNVDRSHPTQSISKSITSLLVGSAIMEGHIESANDLISTYLPEYADLLTGEKSALTIKHLLTMSAGFEWDESSPSNNGSQNVRQQEMRSRDSVAFTLSQPHINEPGRVFGYSGGYVTVIGEIIKNATGADSVLHYLNNGPLGRLAFENHTWLTQRDGRQNTAGGAQLRPRDLAKIGLMVLNDGVWQGEQLVPPGWIRDSLSLQIPGASSNWNEYGYLWWGRDYQVAGRTYHADSAQGLGGQELILIDELDLVVVITADNYITVPLTESFMTNLVIPALN